MYYVVSDLIQMLPYTVGITCLWLSPLLAPGPGGTGKIYLQSSVLTCQATREARRECVSLSTAYDQISPENYKQWLKSSCQTSALKSGQTLVPNKISTTPLVPSRSSQIQRSEVQSALVTVYRATRGRTVVFTCDLAVPCAVPRNRSTSPAVLLFRYSNQSRALLP